MLTIKRLIKKYQLPVSEVKIANNLASNCHKIIARLGFKNKRILLVSDRIIYDNVVGFFDNSFEKLKLLSDFSQLIFDNIGKKKLVANQSNLKRILTKAKDCDLIIALGSGTINDLCKLTSSNLKIPYIIFTSAPSMNGYLSSTASITINKHKKSLPATLPVGVYCDLSILKSSPDYLVKAGIADSLCFYNCYFDVKLSNMILKTKLKEEPFNIVAKNISEFTNSYHQYLLTDEALLKKLITILLIGGISMSVAKSSYPASQAEHLIAHLLEMKYPKKITHIPHGLQIAVTTITASNLQAKILQCKNPAIAANDFIAQNNNKSRELKKYFTTIVFQHCKSETMNKLITKSKAKKLNIFLKTNWPKIKNTLSKIQANQRDLKKIFKHFNINISYKIFKISKKQYQQLIKNAKYIRSRFTCLDFLY